MAEIPALRTDRQNWPTWRTNLKAVLEELGISAYLSQTTPNPYDEQTNALAKCAIASTIPDLLFLRILRFKSAYECFETLRTLFEKPTTTTAVQYELRSDKNTRVAAHSVETATDVRDTSHRDGEVSHGSGRRNNDVPRNNTRRQHQRETRNQGRVDRRKEVGEKGKKSSGRGDKKVTAATGPGKGATDQKAGGVSLVKPMSSQENVPGTHINTPSPPPPTPSLLFEQTAPTSRRLTHQRSWNGHVPRNGTRHTREDDVDVEGSRGDVKSRSRGGREPDDEDGDDDDVHHAHVEPHPPSLTRQMASNKAADTSNLSTTSARPRLPAGTSRGPPNGSNENNGGKGEGNKRASGIAAPSSNGKYAVPDLIPPAPNPDKPGPPPSMPLEGEKGQRSSGHADKTGTHQIEAPRHESRTTPPERTPYNGEGRGVAIGHRQAVGEEDEVGGKDEANDEAKEVEGSQAARNVSYRVDERRRGDQEGQKDEGRPDEGEEHRTAATNANDEDDAPSTPPAPQPPPAPPLPAPNHPEQHDNNNMMKSNKTPARIHADAMHNPGGHTKSPGSVPPSIGLEGEKSKRSSLNVEPMDVQTNDVDVEDDHDNQTMPRGPVGTPDGDTRRPNRPTEPPDEEKGGQRRNGQQETTVREVESKMSSRDVESRGREDERDKSRKVEGEVGDQNGKYDGH
ncbi:hypothetical protein PAXINDRAFT_16409 [Paxillus involutus ATCC 200175]|uniref:Uncharacterized protein n=1 Tax=Paxillus involutus ATCC 200175 TaxID=664439 RepID=A0A0C9T4I4_PAXIN|nr:hypothetical protein PAXINDRAFT_16409 [Paxillus involutus ATCC 200175]